MPAYIYGLRCPLSGQIRYIGKSGDPERRYKAHLRVRKGRSHKDSWIAKLRRSGLIPILEIIRECADGENWAIAEREEIAMARERGWPLTNATLGGEGASLDEAGRAAKKKAMEQPETRAKMSASARARWNDPQSAKMGRDANSTPEKRAKLAEAAKRRATPEYRSMMAEKTKAAWSDKQKRNRIQAGITDDVRSKVSEASKRFWATSPNAEICKANLLPPNREMVEKATRARLTPEALAKRREWSSSPEFREKMSAALKESWARRKREG